MESSVKYLFVLSCFGFAACASGGQKLIITPVFPVIAYEENQIQMVVVNSKDTNGIREGEIFLNDVPFFYNLSRSLKTYRPNRAYAIGYPIECVGSWHAWDSAITDIAAMASLQGCVQNVRDREIHTGKKCGASLVMVNKKLLVNPYDLKKFYRVPFVMQTGSAEGKQDLIFGMFQYEGIGENLPLMVFNDKGKKVFDGSYSLKYMQILIVLCGQTFEFAIYLKVGANSLH